MVNTVKYSITIQVQKCKLTFILKSILKGAVASLSPPVCTPSLFLCPLITPRGPQTPTSLLSLLDRGKGLCQYAVRSAYAEGSSSEGKGPCPGEASRSSQLPDRSLVGDKRGPRCTCLPSPLQESVLFSVFSKRASPRQSAQRD